MSEKDDPRFIQSIEDAQIGELSANGANPARGADDDSMFDPERLRLNQNFADDLGVKTLLTVRVYKPGKQTCFRVHPAPEYRLTTSLLELKDQRETYLVDPALLPSLGEEITNVTLFTCIDRSGNLFLWPTKLPASDGRTNEWNNSAIRIAQLAMTKWVRMQSNMSNGCYEAFVAASKLPDPEWPVIGLKDLLKAAFQDRFIRDLDHPVIQKLRGVI
jgi:hypothetical protein